MRRVQEMLKDANGPDAEDKLAAVRAQRTETGQVYGAARVEQLGGVASDKLVVRADGSRRAADEARYITEEHIAVTSAKK